MKRSTRIAGVFVLLMCALAWAEGKVLCTVRVSATAVDALKPFSDAGVNCAWQAKSVLGLQCPNAEVCYEPAALERRADGGHQVDSRDGGTSLDFGPVATTGSTCVNFIPGQGNADPFVINLGPSERNISLIAAQIGDAGATVDCKFIKTLRAQP